jgi:GMP synthase-like glutamine amidotransferase
MRVQVLQHVPFEGLGSMEPWLIEHGAQIRYTCFFADGILPELAEVDFVIAMGGPMSVNDEESLPWLIEEKRFIAAAIAAGKPVLGVCLGAQLIASCQGARVYPGVEKEIGWWPIHSVPGPQGSFAFPPVSEVFQWHGETFDLPAGAIHLAESPVCRNQAFQIGERVIGLQFHLETTPVTAAAILHHCADELIPGPYVQTADQIQAATSERYEDLNLQMAAVLEYLLRG